jgi:hypothetical protein
LSPLSISDGEFDYYSPPLLVHILWQQVWKSEFGEIKTREHKAVDGKDKVRSLAALEPCVHLQTLALPRKLVEDLTPLRALPYLTDLDLSRNQLT